MNIFSMASDIMLVMIIRSRVKHSTLVYAKSRAQGQLAAIIAVMQGFILLCIAYYSSTQGILNHT